MCLVCASIVADNTGLYLNVYAPSTPAPADGRAVLFWVGPKKNPCTELPCLLVAQDLRDAAIHLSILGLGRLHGLLDDLLRLG